MDYNSFPVSWCSGADQLTKELRTVVIGEFFFHICELISIFIKFDSPVILPFVKFDIFGICFTNMEFLHKYGNYFTNMGIVGKSSPIATTLCTWYRISLGADVNEVPTVVLFFFFVWTPVIIAHGGNGYRVTLLFFSCSRI